MLGTFSEKVFFIEKCFSLFIYELLREENVYSNDALNVKRIHINKHENFNDYTSL